MSSRTSDLLLAARYDPVEDYVVWQSLHLVVEAGAEGVDWRTDIVYRRRFAALMEYPKRADVLEAHYQPWVQPAEGVNERMVPKPDRWPVPQNTPASRNQCEDECEECGHQLTLHPNLRRALAGNIRTPGAIRPEHFERHLAKLAEHKARHQAYGNPTYVCHRCDSSVRRMW